MNISGKRYLVFAGESYPPGGWDDFLWATDDAQKAIERAEESLLGDPDNRWADVVDVTVGLKVWTKGFSFGRD